MKNREAVERLKEDFPEGELPPGGSSSHGNSSPAGKEKGIPTVDLAAIREKYPDIILMADISTYEEGMNAWKCGVDILGTTMSGYTSYSPILDGPDYELMRRLSQDADIPGIGEGRIHEPAQAVEALRTGVWAIVVGGAITRPLEIARRFMNAVEAL